MEKKINIIIDKSGNVKFETVSGFSGTECHNTADILMAGVGTCNGQGDTDDMYKTDDPNVFVIN